MKNIFKNHWKEMNKTHDIPIQEKLDEVKDAVHELDEKLDTYETASGTKKSNKDLDKDFGISEAGPIPNSLLARQDLEGVTKTLNFKVGDTVRVPYHGGLMGKVKKIVAETAYIEYETKDGITRIETFYVNEINKGSIEQTGKQLEEQAEKAEDADTKKEKNEIVDRIKNIQLKRQKAVLAERAPETTSKSFKTLWKKI